MRLVKLTDKLLDLLDHDPEYKFWNFDGQTVVLEDYLEIRPERREDLERHVRGGRILIGPWYALPDEFLISGEATIRNLQRGFRMAEELGCEPELGYLPDMFGHISQMPQILTRFGLKAAFIWRGLSREGLDTEVIWQAPDGSEIFTVRCQEYCGYCNATLHINHLPPEVREEFAPHDPLIEKPEIAARAFKAIADTARAGATGPCVLLLNGIDHMEPQPELPEILRIANEEYSDEVEFIHATLNQFARAVLEHNEPKETVHGELKDTVRSSIGGGIVLPNVLSSRIYLKQQNQACQTALERWAEPTSVFAHLLGFDYPEAFLDKAWQWLLKNHPHDSIGGCSADAIHDQMETRFAWALDIAETLTEENLFNICSTIDTSALNDDEVAVAVFNTLSWPMSDGVDVQIDLEGAYLQRLGVGLRPETAQAAVRGLELCNWDGSPVRYQVSRVEYDVVNRNYLAGMATARPVARVHVSLDADDIPPLGYRLFRARPARKPIIHRGDLVTAPNTMENEFLKVKVQSNGALRITHKESGAVFENCNLFEDGGDNGDGYTYSPPRFDQVFTTQAEAARVALVHDGPAEAAFRIDYAWPLPNGCTPDRQHRSAETTELCVSSLVRLGAKSRRVDIETTVENTVRDHRLRALFPTCLETDRCFSEGQFDVVERPIHVEQPAPKIWKEDQPREYPQQSFCDVSDGSLGLAVVNLGLPEFHVTDDPSHTVCLTLLRAVKYLGAAQFANTIHGGAGPNMETPGSQCRRTLVFRYAVMPHRGVWVEGDVQRQAHQHNVGAKAFTFERHDGPLPAETSLARAESERCILSALMKERQGARIVARVWNGTDDPDDVSFDLHGGVGRVAEIDLRGRNVPDGLLGPKVAVAPKRILTVAAERG